MRYRKKPPEVEAVQLIGGDDGGVFEAFAAKHPEFCFEMDDDHITIPTLEGEMRAYVGDWIVRGVAGEFYVCRDDIFRQTHHQINEEDMAMSATPRIWTLKDELYVLGYGTARRERVYGPCLEEDEEVEVIEKALVDAERERMLDLIERMLAPDRQTYEQAEGEAEELLQADGHLSGKDKTDRCTNSTCDRRATRIAGNAMQADCFYAAPYCETHAREVVEGGGRYVAGPALSLECAKIEGIR